VAGRPRIAWLALLQRWRGGAVGGACGPVERAAPMARLPRLARLNQHLLPCHQHTTSGGKDVDGHISISAAFE
jgi:hypothetical protein